MGGWVGGWMGGRREEEEEEIGYAHVYCRSKALSNDGEKKERGM